MESGGVARPSDSPARLQGRRTLWKIRGGLAWRVHEEPGAGKRGEAKAGAPRGCGSQRTPRRERGPGGADHPPAQPTPRPCGLPPRLGADLRAPGPLLALQRRDSGSTADRGDLRPLPGARAARGSGPVESCSPGLYLFRGLGLTGGRQPRRPEEAPLRAPPPCGPRRSREGVPGARAELSRAGRPPAEGTQGFPPSLDY